MTARTAQTLHVTNGDSVVYLFKKAGILGTHLPWRDILHEGPVPAGLSLEELSRVRATYLATRGLGSPIKLLHDFSARDATLRRAPEFEEVVLWFEHDLYDQLQVAQVLAELDAMNLDPGRISIVQSDEYLGRMVADELVGLFPKRRTVTGATFASAVRTWNAFTSPNPRDLEDHAKTAIPGLPFMRPALHRLFEEFPWVADGLSRSHRQALQAVSQGPARNDELFRRAQAREEASFLGDSAFNAIVEDLKRSPALIEGEEGFLEPTALGRRVLAGDADVLAEGPLDRWIGGVHLVGTDAPRWDDDAATFRTPLGTVDS